MECIRETLVRGLVVFHLETVFRILKDKNHEKVNFNKCFGRANDYTGSG